jgi:hypothetical protein
MSFISNILGGLQGLLSGGDYQANKTGTFYQNAMDQLVNSTGSPAAQTFGKEYQASMQPMFDKQNQSLAAKEASMGITNSGAAKADFQDLGGQQSASLAAGVAPLYQTAIGEYGNLAGQGAGAQNSAYGQAISNFQNMALMAAGAPPTSKAASSTAQGNIDPQTGQPLDAGKAAPLDSTYSANYNPYADAMSGGGGGTPG